MTELRPLPVAVTGAGGFLGRAIVRRLLGEGWAVLALSTGRGAPPEGIPVRPIPAPDAGPEAFRQAVSGAGHLVHAAALNNAARDTAEAEYHAANAELTDRLATAAAASLPGRMLFLSSIRAAVGATFSGEIADSQPEKPEDAYGRSKRAGEIAALAAFAQRPDDLAILRLAPVYGPGMGGNLAALLRMADTPWPLPLGGIGGRRSLLALDAAAAAVAHLLALPRLPPSPLVVSDADALTPGEIVAALREGLGRPARLLRPPAMPLALAARLLGKAGAWAALSASQACHPARLSASGWTPPADSAAGLSRAVSSAGNARA